MQRGNGQFVLNFQPYIDERTRYFIGREWVFRAIDNWLADSEGKRVLLLLGEPGSGKTALAGRLIQISEQIVSSPGEFACLSPGFLSAFHYCSAQDPRWIIPNTFIESLALQLARRYSAFASALAEQRTNRRVQIHIDVQQRIEQGQAIGVQIKQLDVGGTAPEDAFNHTVCEPLEVLLRKEPDLHPLILVDALDEALNYSGTCSIVSLLAQIHTLPTQVRFLLTSRPDNRIERTWSHAMQKLLLSAPEFYQENQNDIRRYVHIRIEGGLLQTQQAGTVEPTVLAQTGALIEPIVQKADGNFQYVYFLLETLASEQWSLTELERLPQGLEELYVAYLQRAGERWKGDWTLDYTPLLGVLAVAQENPTLAQLRAFLPQKPEASLLHCLNDLQQFIEEIQAAGGETRYRTTVALVWEEGRGSTR